MGKIPKKAKKSTKNDVYHFPLRLKKSVAVAVIERAERQNRSINGQIEYELDPKPTPL